MHAPCHILITGASSGIGAALAVEYAAPGICLSLHGRDVARLESTAEQARRRGAVVALHNGDVTDAADMAAWIAARDAVRPLDLVIANAGISGGTSRQPETAAQVAAIFAVNVGGAINTIQPALDIMKKRGRGQIALVSSLAGFRGFAGAPAYCASKAAIRVYGEGLRADMAPHGIAVNVICPGFVKTPMTDVNPFPMPFIMPADRAARIIRRGLEQNRARIAFPFAMYVCARILAAMPQAVMDAIAARMPRK
ncbi:MAG: SDR family NAD(P)-dependent oxidoreductase [Alphaproteobacteria bacterium]|nr:SDR family NAD(P)-dependent oxidoreductase [Alphaproteobacteria bacterium]